MDNDDNVARRHADLQERINSARDKLAQNQHEDWTELSELLEGLNGSLHTDETDPDKRDAHYDRLHGELEKVHGRLNTRADGETGVETEE